MQAGSQVWHVIWHSLLFSPHLVFLPTNYALQSVMYAAEWLDTVPDKTAFSNHSLRLCACAFAWQEVNYFSANIWNYATCYWGSAVVGKPSDAYLFNSISSLLWCFFFRLCPVGCLDAAPAESKSGPSLCFATGVSEAVQLYGAVSSDMLRKSVLGHLQRAEVNNMCI